MNRPSSGHLASTMQRRWTYKLNKSNAIMSMTRNGMNKRRLTALVLDTYLVATPTQHSMRLGRTRLFHQGQ